MADIPAFVREHPGATVSQIADGVGTDAAGVWDEILKLCTLGLVVKYKVDTLWRLYPPED